MAAQPRIDSNSGDDDDGDALALSLLHDLLGVAAFLASNPLHAAYILFFSRYLLSLLAFFCPLLVSTSLLLVVLVTIAPYVGGSGSHSSPEWPGVRFLGRTCGIAVSALCAELRPDGASTGGGVGLVGELCSFVLGPADVAAVLRVGEIMGELCDIGTSCFVLEEKILFLGTEECKELATELPLEGGIGEKIFLDHEDFDEIKDRIEEKNVVCEDLKEFKGPDSSCSEHCCPCEASMQEMEEQEDGIQGQGLSLSDMDGVSDDVEEKRLECDPVSVEIKKCELVKSLSSVSRRIKQWEAQTSVNFKRVLEDMEAIQGCEFSLEKGSFKDVKTCMQLETEACTENLPAQEIASVADSVQHEEEQGFKDVEECLRSETEASTENCRKDLQAEESASIAQPEKELAEQNHKDVQPEPELQEQEYKDVQPEQELQEQDYKDVQPEQEWQDHKHKDVQPEQELQEQEYNDADEESAVLGNGKENSLKSTSIARRVHSRTSSENLVSEESPRKEKEWKRSLACKLYEERMQLKLCRDRAVVECSDNMDMLWEAYEVGGGKGNSSGAKRGRDKAKGVNKQEDEFVVEGEQHGEEEDDDEGSVRQLCCLQALKFSTRKMNFGGGKPSLAKISKVLKRMTTLSRVGSRRNLKG